jgi:hypothetical protein
MSSHDFVNFHSALTLLSVSVRRHRDAFEIATGENMEACGT